MGTTPYFPGDYFKLKPDITASELKLCFGRKGSAEYFLSNLNREYMVTWTSFSHKYIYFNCEYYEASVWIYNEFIVKCNKSVVPRESNHPLTKIFK